MAQQSLSRTGNLKARAAPGSLRLVQVFVNTRDVETGGEELWNPQKLAEWLARQKLMADGVELDTAAWETAIEIREALRDQLRSHNRLKVDGRHVEVLSRAFGHVDAHLFLSGDGVVRVEAAGGGFPGALARLLLAISGAQARNQWKRLKACRGDGCRWIFYDTSKNLSGRWCSAQRCGNRINTLKYRRRGPAYKR